MRRSLAACAVLALCLTACSGGGDDPSPAPTMSGTSSTPTSSGPTSTDPPGGPPQLPEAAKAQTTAGAKAFVTYFADSLNYSWHALDSSPLVGISASDCTVCRIIASKVDKAGRSGGYQRGGGWHIMKIQEIPDSYQNQRHFLVHISIDSGTWKADASSPQHKIVATTVVDEFQIIWRSRWQILNVRST